MPALFDSGSLPATRSANAKINSAMYASPARLVLYRWHGRAHSKNLGGPVKSFLSPHRYDYRLSHALLLYERPGVHKRGR